ncbi:unnamed protein product [Zymoseptoria tritici ST99CH_3D1]|nr:unnamed protein product [Zymoseptoria tritici ST99CH_3D1]
MNHDTGQSSSRRHDSLPDPNDGVDTAKIDRDDSENEVDADKQGGSRKGAALPANPRELDTKASGNASAKSKGKERASLGSVENMSHPLEEQESELNADSESTTTAIQEDNDNQTFSSNAVTDSPSPRSSSPESAILSKLRLAMWNRHLVSPKSRSTPSNIDNFVFPNPEDKEEFFALLDETYGTWSLADKRRKLMDIWAEDEERRNEEEKERSRQSGTLAGLGSWISGLTIGGWTLGARKREESSAREKDDDPLIELGPMNSGALNSSERRIKKENAPPRMRLPESWRPIASSSSSSTRRLLEQPPRRKSVQYHPEHEIRELDPESATLPNDGSVRGEVGTRVISDEARVKVAEGKERRRVRSRRRSEQWRLEREIEEEWEREVEANTKFRKSYRNVRIPRRRSGTRREYRDGEDEEIDSGRAQETEHVENTGVSRAPGDVVHEASGLEYGTYAVNEITFHTSVPETLHPRTTLAELLDSMPETGATPIRAPPIVEDATNNGTIVRRSLGIRGFLAQFLDEIGNEIMPGLEDSDSSGSESESGAESMLETEDEPENTRTTASTDDLEHNGITDEEVIDAMLRGYTQDHRESTYDGGPIQKLDSAIDLLEKEKAGPAPKPMKATLPTISTVPNILANSMMGVTQDVSPETPSTRRRRKKCAGRGDIDHSYSPPAEDSRCSPPEQKRNVPEEELDGGLAATLMCLAARVAEEPDPLRFLVGYKPLSAIRNERQHAVGSESDAASARPPSIATPSKTSSPPTLARFPIPTCFETSHTDPYNQDFDNALEESYNSLGLLSMFSNDRQTPISEQVRTALRSVDEATREKYAQHIWSMGLRSLWAKLRQDPASPRVDAPESGDIVITITEVGDDEDHDETYEPYPVFSVKGLGILPDPSDDGEEDGEYELELLSEAERIAERVRRRSDAGDAGDGGMEGDVESEEERRRRLQRSPRLVPKVRIGGVTSISDPAPQLLDSPRRGENADGAGMDGDVESEEERMRRLQGSPRVMGMNRRPQVPNGAQGIRLVQRMIAAEKEAGMKRLMDSIRLSKDAGEDEEEGDLYTSSPWKTSRAGSVDGSMEEELYTSSPREKVTANARLEVEELQLFPTDSSGENPTAMEKDMRQDSGAESSASSLIDEADSGYETTNAGQRPSTAPSAPIAVPATSRSAFDQTPPDVVPLSLTKQTSATSTSIPSAPIPIPVGSKPIRPSIIIPSKPPIEPAPLSATSVNENNDPSSISPRSTSSSTSASRQLSFNLDGTAQD